MAEVRAERRLAAILTADVVGYSRLIEADEEGTRTRLRSLHAELIDPQVAADGGRIVKTMGDGILVEFPSAINAVRNALAIQQAMRQRNATIPEANRIEFRVGINVGDIIVEGEDIHGDGVNVASRLEGLCDPGAVYVSGTVFDQTAGKLAVLYDDLGEQTVKNISKPVRVYRARVAPTADAGQEPRIAESPPPLPDKPSIAVLPFTNMSGDEEQEYFADGIAEDIITGLSKFHWFFVIARNSSFTYKGSAVDVKQVADELGVQYVLEGSVRKSANRVRITAQLIDAPTGRHIWAERYDRDLDDIFAVQDEITQAIVGEVAPSFISAEAKRVERKTTENLDAWDYCLRGRYLLHRGKDDVAEARRLLEKAVELDPNSSMALGSLAVTLGWMINFGWVDDPKEAREKAHSLARRAVELDDTDAEAHIALGSTRFYTGDLEGAVTASRRALELNPNLATAEAWLGIFLSWSGVYDEAILHARKAQRLSPRDSYSITNFARTCAEYGAGNYEEAVEWAKKTIEVTPEFPVAWLYLTFSLGNLDRLDEAKAAADHVMRLSPQTNLRILRDALPSKRPEEMDRRIEGLRKAGIPE
jgi:TolB-like protein/cytochrome c-type biogenesis protein CcmH/NrfG